MPGEIRRVLRFCLSILNAFGFKEYTLYLATKPKEKSVGDVSQWDAAIGALKDAVTAEGLTCEMDEGGGAFYGPKIDIKIKDALNREWQCSTIQFDFNEPERFDMSYVGADGKKVRPYMIHRALMGSLERFFGILIEHYAGAFPLWLSPVQAIILNITDAQADYAKEVFAKLNAAGLRIQFDSRNEKIGFKIREATLQKIPFMLVIGDKEKEASTVTVRARNGKDLGAMALDKLVTMLKEEIANHGQSL
jgi:threonyl-tRNA synthetase